MIHHYETEILEHIVSVRRNLVGRFVVSIAGPSVNKECPKSFVTLHEAKGKAHVFAHSELGSRCECKDLEWRIEPDAPKIGLVRQAPKHDFAL